MYQDKLSPRYKLHKRLHKLLRDAIKDFSLIEKGDKILLALSGGKDSIALLDLMGENMLHCNSYYSIEAIHVKVKSAIYQTDLSYLESLCYKWNIPLHIVEIELEADTHANRTPCFLCSWNRRKTLFEAAKKLHCNKIALGHHQDDIIRTALMNLTFNGDFSTMPVRITMSKFPITIIRPLAKIQENDLKEWAKLQQYRPLRKICRYDNESNRTTIELITDVIEKINPNYRSNFWHALLKSDSLIE